MVNIGGQHGKTPRYLVHSKKKPPKREPAEVSAPEPEYYYDLTHKRQGLITFYVDKVNDKRWLVGFIRTPTGNKIPTTIDIKQVISYEVTDGDKLV